MAVLYLSNFNKGGSEFKMCTEYSMKRSYANNGGYYRPAKAVVGSYLKGSTTFRRGVEPPHPPDKYSPAKWSASELKFILKFDRKLWKVITAFDRKVVSQYVMFKIYFR